MTCKVCGLDITKPKRYHSASDTTKFVHDVTLPQLLGRCMALNVPLTHRAEPQEITSGRQEAA